MIIYFMLWVVIPYYFINFASQIVPAMAIGNPLIGIVFSRPYWFLIVHDISFSLHPITSKIISKIIVVKRTDYLAMVVVGSLTSEYFFTVHEQCVKTRLFSFLS